jgi:hypothetical protein
MQQQQLALGVGTQEPLAAPTSGATVVRPALARLCSQRCCVLCIIRLYVGYCWRRARCLGTGAQGCSCQWWCRWWCTGVLFCWVASTVHCVVAETVCSCWPCRAQASFESRLRISCSTSTAAATRRTVCTYVTRTSSQLMQCGASPVPRTIAGPTVTAVWVARSEGS